MNSPYDLSKRRNITRRASKNPSPYDLSEVGLRRQERRDVEAAKRIIERAKRLGW